MHNAILSDNPILKIYEKFPWLANSIHETGGTSEYLYLLNRFNEQKYNTTLKKYPCATQFSIDVLEALKASFLNLTLMSIGNNFVWNAFFQPENNFFICASVGANNITKDLTVFFDIYTSSIDKFYNFLESVENYTYEGKSGFVGFST